MKIKIKLTIETDWEVPDHYDEYDQQFYLEESLCAFNVLKEIYQQEEILQEKGHCNICSHSEIEIISQ